MRWSTCAGSLMLLFEWQMGLDGAADDVGTAGADAASTAVAEGAEEAGGAWIGMAIIAPSLGSPSLSSSP